MKPLIGISVESRHDEADARGQGHLHLNWNYASMVAEAGGVPILMPPTADPETLAGLIDGWLIPGGADIDARRWGEENHEKVELQHPSRFDFEASLYRAADPELPIFGICYGCQFLNVVRGGTLIQHVPDVVGHGGHSGGNMQEYAIESASKLAAESGADRISGKSYHHQAVGRLAVGLAITARAEDGTIEAVEANDRPWQIGVQWHPERTPSDPPTRRLFEAFVAAAGRYKEAKAHREAVR